LLIKSSKKKEEILIDSKSNGLNLTLNKQVQFILIEILYM